MGCLNDQVALVTGAGGAIADGIALRLAEEGASLFLVGDREADIEPALQRVRALAPASRASAMILAHKADAQEAVNAALSAFGRLDILINVTDDKEVWSPLEDLAEGEIEARFSESATAVLWMMQSALPFLRERAGRIVNVVASYGDFVNRYIGAYKAACEAVKGFSITAAHEWGASGIRVNILVPAADTPAFRRYREQNKDQVDWALRQKAIPRMGDPIRDIGGAALFLVSDDSRYITGHVIYADGGQHIAPSVFEPGL